MLSPLFHALPPAPPTARPARLLGPPHGRTKKKMADGQAELSSRAAILETPSMVSKRIILPRRALRRSKKKTGERSVADPTSKKTDPGFNREKIQSAAHHLEPPHTKALQLLLA